MLVRSLMIKVYGQSTESLGTAFLFEGSMLVCMVYYQWSKLQYVVACRSIKYSCLGIQRNGCVRSCVIGLQQKYILIGCHYLLISSFVFWLLHFWAKRIQRKTDIDSLVSPDNVPAIFLQEKHGSCQNSQLHLGKRILQIAHLHSFKSSSIDWQMLRSYIYIL
jgi:hypothetical protein